jgi:hypothetical protein
MTNARLFFHRISYLQYPLLVLGMVYVYKPLLFGIDTLWVDYNKSLVFLGLALSMSTLQDTTKTQNKFSEKIWKDPRKSRLAITYLSFFAGLFVVVGLVALFSTFGPLHELAFGLIALGVGCIGIVKSALEMAEFQQRSLRESELQR